MLLLLAHAAAIPIHIPLAGALTHPDPSDLDLLTFAMFEGAFVCICAAYLFGGLAKDQIAERYRRASLTDPLTGVANRRGFFEAGKRLLKRARLARQPTALIMFDLDRFKSINDRYGHHTGDEVLTAFCRLASSQLRPNDLFGRIGGEEFAALLQIRGEMTPFGWPSGCAGRSKPPPIPLDSMRLAQPSASAFRFQTKSVLISARYSMRPIERSIAQRRWGAIE